MQKFLLEMETDCPRKITREKAFDVLEFRA